MLWKERALSGEEPDIEFEELAYDFGTIGQNLVVSHIFEFKNSGQSELVISLVESSCSCTGALLSDKRVPPGGTGAVEIKFNSGEKIGRRTERVSVYSNDPQEPLVLLTVTGIIEGSTIPVLPGYISLKNISNKKAIERKVEVIDPGSGRLEVTGVETTSPYMNAQIVSTVKGEDGKTEIRLVVNPGMPLGEINEKLIIFTNEPKEPKIEIPICGNVVGGLIAFPDRFFLGMVDKGQVVSRDITVSQDGEKDRLSTGDGTLRASIHGRALPVSSDSTRIYSIGSKRLHFASAESQSAYSFWGFYDSSGAPHRFSPQFSKFWGSLDIAAS